MLDDGLVGWSSGLVEWGVPADCSSGNGAVSGVGWSIVDMVQWGVPVVIVQW